MRGAEKEVSGRIFVRQLLADQVGLHFAELVEPLGKLLPQMSTFPSRLRGSRKAVGGYAFDYPQLIVLNG
jgi:hypothetical protein